MAKSSQKYFPAPVREQVLLWCGRHCCICGRQCGLDIELHHINPKLSLPALNKEDNAIPVCYDCHSKLELSQLGSPRGSRWTHSEIKARREQVYEDHTRHLVPVLTYGPVNDPDDGFPKVRFFLQHNEGGLPVKALLRVEILIDGKLFGTPVRHYAGRHEWTCNPGVASVGWFDFSNEAQLNRRRQYRSIHPKRAKSRDLRLRVSVIVIDQFRRHHPRLPVEWYFAWDRQTWVLDP